MGTEAISEERKGAVTLRPASGSSRRGRAREEDSLAVRARDFLAYRVYVGIYVRSVGDKRRPLDRPVGRMALTGARLLDRCAPRRESWASVYERTDGEVRT